VLLLLLLLFCCVNRAAQLDKLGLGYSALSSINPRLIYASLSAYGTRGPLTAAPGYDVMVAAQGGLMHITGHDDQPAKPGVALTDITTGLYLHGAIMAALLQRHSTGRGQHVQTSLYQSQTAALSMVMQSQLVDPTWQARRWGTAHSSIVPYQSFSCKDGRWIVAGALSDGQWRVMRDVLQLTPNCCNNSPPPSPPSPARTGCPLSLPADCRAPRCCPRTWCSTASRCGRSVCG